MNFCAISTIPSLDLVKGRKWHLVLAHLIEKDLTGETDGTYTNFYKNESENGSTILVDNSAFEYFKAGKDMLESSKLIEIAKAVKGDYIVMSDYPNDFGGTTISTAEVLIPKIKAAGFKTFFVPQSKIGDLEDYINTWEWAAKNTDIDMIGLSILGAPNAYGVEKNNKLQRYLSRFWILKELDSRGILNFVRSNRIHCLGMIDGPNELEFLKQYEYWINSIDSSQPLWHGNLGIKYDNSPTGLIDGKNETEVDFNQKLINQDIGLQNLETIDKILRR